MHAIREPHPEESFFETQAHLPRALVLAIDLNDSKAPILDLQHEQFKDLGCRLFGKIQRSDHHN
jgi:hypothetical protein